jgi:3-hydroxyisobutyrate dehydrogenase
MTVKDRIAVIGLGRMGLPMSLNLLKEGYLVQGFDLSTEANNKFSEAGGIPSSSVDEAIKDASVIITMLPNGEIVRSVLCDGEAWRCARDGAILIEMSSSSPLDTRALSENIGSRIRVVDAPVSGGVKRAIDGTLTVMAGGAEKDLAKVSPVLESLAKNVFYCGPVGAGHAMKAINNYVSGAGVIAACEAVQLAQAFGMDSGTVVDVLNASSGKNNATEVKMKQFILSGSFSSGFALGLMAKDIGIAAQLSEELGLTQEGLMQTAEKWDSAMHAVGGDVDHTRIYETLSKPAKKAD